MSKKAHVLRDLNEPMRLIERPETSANSAGRVLHASITANRLTSSLHCCTAAEVIAEVIALCKVACQVDKGLIIGRARRPC